MGAWMDSRFWRKVLVRNPSDNHISLQSYTLEVYITLSLSHGGFKIYELFRAYVKLRSAGASPKEKPADSASPIEP